MIFLLFAACHRPFEPIAEEEARVLDETPSCGDEPVGATCGYDVIFEGGSARFSDAYGLDTRVIEDADAWAALAGELGGTELPGVDFACYVAVVAEVGRGGCDIRRDLTVTCTDEGETYVDVVFEASCASPMCDAWLDALVILQVPRAAKVTPCARVVCPGG